MRKIVALALALLLAGCGGGSGSEVTSTESVNVEIDASIETQPDAEVIISRSIYFSQTEGSFEGGVDELIVADIDTARERIRLMMYDFTNDKILDALLRAWERGVDLRVHTDDSKIDEEAYQTLIARGVPVTSDVSPYGLMHDKALVIDGSIVWMGSANYTYYAFYRNNENIIRWESRQLATAYEREFDERVGDELIPGVFEAVDLRLYFTPEDDFRSQIISLIDAAQNEIEFMIYSFTDDQIADALIRAYERGVVVRGIFDEDQDLYQSSSEYETLLEAGLDVHLDGNNYKLHHKVMIIDANTTITGSYNFTDAAQTKNFEEGMVILGESTASAFLGEFWRCYGKTPR